MAKDTRCNYCGNLYDHKTGKGHKPGCKMKRTMKQDAKKRAKRKTSVAKRFLG